MSSRMVATNRVVITGMSGVTAFGNNWVDISARIYAGQNAVPYMPQWAEYRGLTTHLGARLDDFVVPAH